MMNLIKLNASKYTPGVIMDPVNDVIQFTGSSMPENAMDFFFPIIKWAEDYYNSCNDKAKDKKVLQVTFNLSYQNSASHRAFLELFRVLKKINEKGMKVTVDWFHERDDEHMLEGGKILSEMSDLNVCFQEV